MAKKKSTPLRSPMRLEKLADEQGVSPVTDFDALSGDFWPKEESTDAFISAVDQWRCGKRGEDHRDG